MTHTLSDLKRIYRTRWPEIWAESLEIGLLRSTPRLFLLVVAMFFMIILIPLTHACRITWSTTGKVYSQLTYTGLRRTYRQYLERQQRNKGFDRFALKSSMIFNERAQLRQAEGIPLEGGSPPSKCVFSLPPEIRRLILVYAFGNRTLHLSLEFRHQIQLRHRGGVHSSHADLSWWPDDIAPEELDPKLLRDWRWFSTVCHRAPPPEKLGVEPLSFGRITCGKLKTSEPNLDTCLHGLSRRGHCDEWPGEYPSKCMIGATGWLLSCKQAYKEGMHVLYSTNTIHIASTILLRSVQRIISPVLLSSLRSLELVWNPDELAFDLGFNSHHEDESGIMRSPLFSSLAHLRISFLFDRKGSSYERVADDPMIMERKIFSKLDVLLDRIVPSSTEVIVSCPVPETYENILFQWSKIHGNEIPSPKQADIGGLMIWRPRIAPKADRGRDLEEGGFDSLRTGFWIHQPTWMAGFDVEGRYGQDLPVRIPRWVTIRPYTQNQLL
ncbi:unnamed protein product [Clonostachys rosea]|uniref:F-box domain-containing protein n=1 Tax=Bionectria ochroleuca TaxID=29856 RepID=A0ABY6U163_BIOOC|nr:unnamed protein product [Clonostachys rosea]